MLMDELQAALENIDSPEHLPTCINPLVIIAQNYHPVSFPIIVFIGSNNIVSLIVGLQERKTLHKTITQ